MVARTSYALAALLALAVALAALLVAVDGRAADPAPRPERSPEPAPAAVLAAWDRQRAEAWAAGDPAALAALYAPGSSAGERDVRMLRRYVRRDLRVEGLRTQRLRVVVVERTPGHLVLRVRDRVVGGTVRGAGVAVRLPRDRDSGHLVELERVGPRWLVTRVETERSASALMPLSRGPRR